MSDDEERALHICNTVTELERPYVPSVRGACITCNEPLWVDPLSCEEVEGGPHDHSCMGCALALLKSTDKIRMPTSRQLKAMRTHLRDSN